MARVCETRLSAMALYMLLVRNVVATPPKGGTRGDAVSLAHGTRPLETSRARMCKAVGKKEGCSRNNRQGQAPPLGVGRSVRDLMLKLDVRHRGHFYCISAFDPRATLPGSTSPISSLPLPISQLSTPLTRLQGCTPPHSAPCAPPPPAPSASRRSTPRRLASPPSGARATGRRRSLEM